MSSRGCLYHRALVIMWLWTRGCHCKIAAQESCPTKDPAGPIHTEGVLECGGTAAGPRLSSNGYLLLCRWIECFLRGVLGRWSSRLAAEKSPQLHGLPLVGLHHVASAYRVDASLMPIVIFKHHVIYDAWMCPRAVTPTTLTRTQPYLQTGRLG